MGLVERVNAAIDAALVNRIVGCVVLIHRNGEEIYARAAGFADREAERAMKRDAIFRLASITKPIVATATLHMQELGLLDIDDAITNVLPWFTPQTRDGTRPTILIRHLLTHTSGITYDVPPDVSPGMSGPIISLEENLRRLAMAPLAFAPGRGWAYGMGTDVLGGVLAAINGSNLEAVLAEYVCHPLIMPDTHFYVADTKRLTVPYADGLPPKRMSEPEKVLEPGGGFGEFSPGRILNAEAPQSGSGGMAGTADDVMKLLDSFNSTNPILRPETITAALTNQIGMLPRPENDAGKRFNFIGSVVDDPKVARTPCPAGTVEWGGTWGHNWIIDPVNHLSILTCTNTAFEGCWGPFREDIRDAVYSYKDPSIRS